MTFYLSPELSRLFFSCLFKKSAALTGLVSCHIKCLLCRKRQAWGSEGEVRDSLGVSFYSFPCALVEVLTKGGFWAVHVAVELQELYCN